MKPVKSQPLILSVSLILPSLSLPSGQRLGQGNTSQTPALNTVITSRPRAYGISLTISKATTLSCY